MAAPSNNFIRVRLEFDYPPPALVDCRMCWLLVDLNTCRVVADLESIIREKFEFSRRSILNLFIESCYLPHTESIYVVRDNDSVRVKLEYLDLVNGDSRVPEKANESTRKRRRHAEEHQKEENKAGVERKKKRRVEKQDVKQASVHEKEQGKCKEKKKKKKKSEKKVKSAASTKNSPVKVDQPLKPKKPPVAQQVSSSSSSEEQEAPQKPAPNSPFSAPTSSCKQSQPKQRLPSSSSSESSSDEANTNKSASQPTPQHTHTPTNDALTSQLTPPVKSLGNCAQNQTSSTLEQPSKSSVSGSEEEIEFVIRKPVQPPGFGVGGPSYLGGFGRRGKNGRDGSAQRERGRGGNRGGFRGQTGSFERDNNGVNHPSYQTDSLSNASVVLQNKTENTPKDYGSMPLLAAPPQVGQRIAFKVTHVQCY
uniref:Coilin p80 n=1 Tax=Takifugu rubripes TaxID=31033 RepID=A0A674PDK9_TAKRU